MAHARTLDRGVTAWLCAVCPKSHKGIIDGTNITSNLEVYTFILFTWFVIKQINVWEQFSDVQFCYDDCNEVYHYWNVYRPKEYLCNSVTGKIGCVDSLTRFCRQLSKILWAVCIY
jgi:hypothetical protein